MCVHIPHNDQFNKKNGILNWSISKIEIYYCFELRFRESLTFEGSINYLIPNLRGKIQILKIVVFEVSSID
jgi:hypothetical protein